MSKSKREIVESGRKDAEHSFDGTISHVFPDYVHVRLRDQQRRILRNVVIADHIDKDKLGVGKYCMVSSLFDRSGDRTGRFMLTAILPVPVYSGANVQSAVPKPGPPAVSAELDCETETFTITWTQVQAALSYKLFQAIDSLGTNAVEVADVTNLSYTVPLSSTGYVFFAVKSVGPSGESSYSNWATDNNYFDEAGIVAFGDDALHGDVISSAIRFKITVDGVFRSENHGVSYPHNITPSSVFNDWGDTVNIDDVEFSQVISTTGLMFVFGKWENLSVEKQGWFWGSIDNGETWTDYSIRWNLETEGYPIWASLGDTDLFITVWLDGENVLHKYPLSNITGGPTSEISLGVATLVQVEDKEKWAFPVWAASDEVYVAGRFNSPSDDAIAHIVKFDVGGPTWTDVIDDWDTDVCTALSVEENGTDRLFYATRETLI